MQMLLYIAPSIMIAVLLFGAFRGVGIAMRRARAWNGGATAQGRCLRAVTHSSDGEPSPRARRHYIYEFTAADGRVVRFEEKGGPATRVEGDPVTVHYAEGREEHATAEPPGYRKNVLNVLVMLTVVALLIGFCVFFMIVATPNSAAAPV